MAFTSNIYEENTLRQLAQYGIIHQGFTTTWKSKNASMYVLLCSTDLTEYSSSFVGTVAELLASGVTELATGNGYFAGGQPAPWFVNLGTFTGIGLYLRGFATSAWYAPRATVVNPSTGSSVNWDSIRWGAVGGSISALSALLCFESPISTAATINERSYPLVMWDFGGVKTASTGSSFTINWNASGAISWAR
jgi:hypothetical protein